MSHHDRLRSLVSRTTGAECSGHLVGHLRVGGGSANRLVIPVRKTFLNRDFIPAPQVGGSLPLPFLGGHLQVRL
jgi:hypothetical protein